MGMVTLSPGIRRPKHEADHLPPSYAEIRNDCRHNSTLPPTIRLRVLNRNSFTSSEWDVIEERNKLTRICFFYSGFPSSVLTHQIIVQLLLYAFSGCLWFFMFLISTTFTRLVFTLPLFLVI